MKMTKERQKAFEELKVLQVEIKRMEVEMSEAVQSGMEHRNLWDRLDTLRVRRLVLENTFLPGNPPDY